MQILRTTYCVLKLKWNRNRNRKYKHMMDGWMDIPFINVACFRLNGKTNWILTSCRSCFIYQSAQMIPLRLQYYNIRDKYTYMCVLHCTVQTTKKHNKCVLCTSMRRAHARTLHWVLYGKRCEEEIIVYACMRYLTQPFHSLSFHSSSFFLRLWVSGRAHVYASADDVDICTTHASITQNYGCGCFCLLLDSTLFCCLLLFGNVLFSLNLSLV